MTFPSSLCIGAIAEMSMRGASRLVVDRKKLLDRADHRVDFVIPQFGEQRQGNVMTGVAFGFGKRKRAKAAIQPSPVAVKRCRVVNARSNLSRSKELFQLISIDRFNDIL